MQEALLQFIWQYSLYRPAALYTQSGERVEVQSPGTRNTDAGPDFSMARVKVGETLLVGNVELHVRSSDWQRHRHDADTAYDRVILHVVYEDDGGHRREGLPLLELRDHIPEEVLQRYTDLIQTTAVLPCAASLGGVHDMTRRSWMSRMLVERWEQKLEQWAADLKQAGGDWHTLYWWRLAANFGFKVNAGPFLLLAQSLPLRLLLKQPGLLQLEALLYGQAGFLEGSFTDDYPHALQAEFAYLKTKYRLAPMEMGAWKFMRLRPANFPSLRIAQLAALLHRAPALIHSPGGSEDVAGLMQALSVPASEYWDRHYRFEDAPHVASRKMLGTDAAHNIIINTIAPIRFLYSHEQGRPRDAEAALQMLEALPAENNKITRMWATHGWASANAADSQSLIQLFNSYCSSKRCLECAVGLSIIRAR